MYMCWPIHIHMGMYVCAYTYVYHSRLWVDIGIYICPYRGQSVCVCVCVVMLVKIQHKRDSFLSPLLDMNFLRD